MAELTAIKHIKGNKYFFITSIIKPKKYLYNKNKQDFILEP